VAAGADWVERGPAGVVGCGLALAGCRLSVVDQRVWEVEVVVVIFHLDYLLIPSSKSQFPHSPALILPVSSTCYHVQINTY